MTPGTSYTGYFVSVTGSGVWSIIRVDKASPVTLATRPTQPLAVGDQIGVRVVGTTITALRFTATSGWTRMLTYDTSVDTTRYSTAGRSAIEFRAAQLDDFGAATLGSLTLKHHRCHGTPEVGKPSSPPSRQLERLANSSVNQWQDCDAGGANCTPISGATGSVYTVALADAGFTIEVVATATNSAGAGRGRFGSHRSRADPPAAARTSRRPSPAPPPSASS